MILLINNSTEGNTLSFIYQVRNTLKNLNVEYIETNKIDESILKKNIKGIIISGSPMELHTDTLDNYNYNIYYLLNIDAPVLGICFGCQLLTTLYGGSIKNRGELFCQTADITISNSFLFKNLNPLQLKFCFNDITLSPKKTQLVKELAWLYIDNKEYPIAFEFKKQKIFGILGHPELNEQSRIIYKNFIDFCKTWRNND